jgi:hypothetical protein
MEEQIIGSVFKGEEFSNPNNPSNRNINFSQVVAGNSKGSLESWKEEYIW